MGTSLQQQVLQALARARLTGQPIVIPGAQGLVATPQGGTRMATPMELQRANIPFFANQTSPFGPVPTGASVPVGTPANAPAQPGWMHLLAGPNMQVTNQPTGATLVNPFAATPPAPAVLNQANPNIQTYAGQPGWGGVPQAAAAASQTDPATAARNYRLAHGLGTAQDRMTADQLNAMSLQAAQQGRTYWPPGTTVGTGQYAPNLLQMPPAAVPANANALAGGGAWLPNIHWLQGLAGPSGPPDNAQGGGGGVG